MPPVADASGRQGVGRVIAYALALVVFGLAGATAQAADYGPGGAASTPKPTVLALACVEQCEAVRAARPDALVRLRGRNLDYTDQVVFLGLEGEHDDVVAEPAKVRKRAALVQVPKRAQSGPVAVQTADGVRSAPSRSTLGIIRGSAKRTTEVIDVELSSHKIFFDSARAASLTFMVRQPADVLVELVRGADGAVISSWEVGQVGADSPRTVTWDGTAGGKVQAEGRYDFRVLARSQDGALMASSAQLPDGEAVDPASFLFLRHKFPIRGRHDYGESQAAFGGGRNHQGHDVFAACGTPLVAARGGTVKIKQTHSRAGNYVVIDGEATGDDYVYMHLRDEALVDKGDRVRTGQLIGYVGDTGRAHGCHLHFEMWSGPGWYTGGSPFDPLPHLKAWDKTS